ncbi:MAG: MBL fold metallo-hydrolase [Acidobacteria bacterium]|nr:MBL fold metallo-hydrolase [Acidobacteriota bacterium]
MRRLLPGVVVACAFLGAASDTSAQPDLSAAQIGTVKVTDGLWMLTGPGGNIGVSAGADAVFLIDDQYAPLTDKVKAAIAGITPSPVKFVLNTHWHFDHTGGNENLGKVGALLVAHDNVRSRMSVEQFIEALDMKVPASPPAALPVVTFSETVTFHLNGEEIHAFHVPPAHTDGDSVVHFRKANVVHMGDLFFNGSYPFIDLSSGGSIDGVIAAADRVLKMIDGNTKIMPGHGPLADRAALQAYRQMVASARERLSALVAAGRTEAEVIAAQPLKDYDQKWGAGFMKPDVFLKIVYADLKKRQ